MSRVEKLGDKGSFWDEFLVKQVGLEIGKRKQMSQANVALILPIRLPLNSGEEPNASSIIGEICTDPLHLHTNELPGSPLRQMQQSATLAMFTLSAFFMEKFYKIKFRLDYSERPFWAGDAASAVKYGNNVDLNELGLHANTIIRIASMTRLYGQRLNPVYPMFPSFWSGSMNLFFQS